VLTRSDGTALVTGTNLDTAKRCLVLSPRERLLHLYVENEDAVFELIEGINWELTYDVQEDMMDCDCRIFLIQSVECLCAENVQSVDSRAPY
jgi:hypothetical protein